MTTKLANSCAIPIWQGARDFTREVFGRPSARNHLTYQPLCTAGILLLATVGLVRNLLEVALHIELTPKWYSLDADIVFTMLNFAPFLCFFGATSLYLTALACGVSLPFSSLLSLSFFAQGIHLFIPFFDAVGMAVGIPWGFRPSSEYILTATYTNTLVMTFGIIVAWIVTLRVYLRVFLHDFGVSLPRALLILLIAYQFILWPTYYVWPTFNTAFNALFLPGGTVRDYWGYGTFFLMCAVLSMAYSKWRLRQ